MDKRLLKLPLLLPFLFFAGCSDILDVEFHVRDAAGVELTGVTILLYQVSNDQKHLRIETSEGNPTQLLNWFEPMEIVLKKDGYRTERLTVTRKELERRSKTGPISYDPKRKIYIVEATMERVLSGT